MGQPLEQLATAVSKTIHVAECSKAALIKIQKELGGSGIICADEVSQFLTGMLKRASTDSTGIRPTHLYLIVLSIFLKKY